VLQLARENRWGDDRITGELKKLGYRISHEKVRQILRHHGILPVPERRSSSTWRTFLNHYKETLLACDFFTVETIRMQTLYVFFSSKLGRGVFMLLELLPIPPKLGSHSKRAKRFGSYRCTCEPSLI
jgi:hypothetical protein